MTNLQTLKQNQRPISQPRTGEIFHLRSLGHLEEALDIAKEDYENFPTDKRVNSAYYWVLYSLCKDRYLDSTDTTTLVQSLNVMKQLLPQLYDQNGYAKRCYDLLCSRALPHATLIHNCNTACKEHPLEAYTQLRSQVRSAQDLDPSLHTSYAWILYRYLQAVNNSDMTRQEAQANASLYHEYFTLQVDRPSRLHSCMLRSALRFKENLNKEKYDVTFSIVAFLREWDVANFTEEDWQQTPNPKGGNYSSLAEKAAKACYDEIKDNYHRDQADVLWLKSIYKMVLQHVPDDDWLLRQSIGIDTWMGDTSQVIDRYKHLLLSKPDKFFLWNELGDFITNNEKIKAGLYVHARNTGSKEEFVGKIHLKLARLYLRHQSPAASLAELEAYSRCYTQNGWKLNDDYKQLRDQIPQGTVAARDFAMERRCEDAALEMVYSDIEWKQRILAERWTSPGDKKERCMLLAPDGTQEKTKTARFPILHKLKMGTVIELKEITQRRNDGNQSKPVSTILLVRATSLEPWSLLPATTGVVTFSNTQKKFSLINSTDSKRYFYPAAPSNLPKGTIVTMRAYKETSDKGSGYKAVFVTPCSNRDQALAEFRHCIAVVSWVDEAQGKFHIVDNDKKLSETLRCCDAGLQPTMGQKLRIAYCYETDKHGRCHFLPVDVKTYSD